MLTNPKSPALLRLGTRRAWHGLPREFYHTPELYALELDHIWRSGWLFAGFTCEVPNPGDYLTLSVDTDPLVVIRGEDGQIRAFHNVCRHRGMLLCHSEHGHARRIVCPYHQWTYSSRGELLSCRGMHPGIDTRELGLQPVQVESVAGLIFVSLSRNPPPFAPVRELYASQVGPQGLDRARVAHVIDYNIAADWKVVWENNRECYHCDVNHPEYIRSNYDTLEAERATPEAQARMAAVVAASEQRFAQMGLDVAHRRGGIAPFPDPVNNVWYSATRTVLAPGFVTESLDGAPVAPLMGDYPSPDVGVLRLRALPNFWGHCSCDHAAITRLLPAGQRKTQARVYWLVNQTARPGSDYDLDRVLPVWQRTSEQDWQLCEMTQRGIDSSAYQPGPLSQHRERNVEAFFEWYLTRLGLTSSVQPPDHPASSLG